MRGRWRGNPARLRVPHIKVLADLEVGDARFSIDMQDLKDLKNRSLQKKVCRREEHHPENPRILEILIQTMKNAGDRPPCYTVRGQKPYQARKTCHPANLGNLGNPALNPANPDRWRNDSRPETRPSLFQLIFG